MRPLIGLSAAAYDQPDLILPIRLANLTLILVKLSQFEYYHGRQNLCPVDTSESVVSISSP